MCVFVCVCVYFHCVMPQTVGHNDSVMKCRIFTLVKKRGRGGRGGTCKLHILICRHFLSVWTDRNLSDLRIFRCFNGICSAFLEVYSDHFDFVFQFVFVALGDF